MVTRTREATSKTVSIIVPVRNEEHHVAACIHSILNQDYPIEKLEVIFVDGGSEDRTGDIINGFVRNYPGTFRILKNPYRTVPYAMNIGIEHSIGKYIVRLDAHSEYPADYLSACIATLEETGADNVGGLIVTKGRGVVGEAFAQVLSSKFGVGSSGFRIGAASGYIDTVPFGTFRREVFEKYGLYDVRLSRNQDYELNYRIRKNGGEVYLNSDIRITYYCRNSFAEILKQSFANGKWNIITVHLCPNSMSARHFVPLGFVLSLIAIPLLMSFIRVCRLVLILELGLYVALDLFYSMLSVPKGLHLPLMFILYPIFHVSYGFGSIIGLLECMASVTFREKRNIE